MTLLAYLAAIEARVEAATKGPWSWGYIGEKSNGYVVGLSCKEDGTPLAGLVEEREDMVDQILYQGQIGEHEAATCNYADPAFIAHARTDLPRLVQGLRLCLETIEAIAEASASSQAGLYCTRTLAALDALGEEGEGNYSDPEVTLGEDENTDEDWRP